MAENLDEFVRQLGESVDADYQTRLSAARAAEKARQDFLQSFRDVADRIILPVFKAAEHSSAAMTVKVESRADEVSINVRLKKSETESVSGYLRYKAQLDRRQIMREEHVERLPRRERSVPAYEYELTPEKITEFVASLLGDAKYALDSKPAY